MAAFKLVYNRQSGLEVGGRNWKSCSKWNWICCKLNILNASDEMECFVYFNTFYYNRRFSDETLNLETRLWLSGKNSSLWLRYLSCYQHMITGRWNLNSNVPPCLWKPLWLQGLVLKSLNSLNPWQKLFSSLVKVFPNNNCEKENPARVHFHCLMILFLLAENSRLLDLLFPLFLNQDHLFHFPKNLIYKEIILLQQY